MAENAQFTATANTARVRISTANTNRDGSGTIGNVFAAGASGSRIERVRIKATSTTTAGMVRMYTYDGSTYRLYEEIAVSAITPSATVESFEATVTLGNGAPLTLATGWSLGFSTHNAETFDVTVIGGDF